MRVWCNTPIVFLNDTIAPGSNSDDSDIRVVYTMKLSVKPDAFG